MQKDRELLQEAINKKNEEKDRDVHFAEQAAQIPNLLPKQPLAAADAERFAAARLSSEADSISPEIKALPEGMEYVFEVV